jgi:RES domain-containing protein
LISVFRLFSPQRKPWDATGAYLFGGRWNSPGQAALYTASSLSLACLEILVHIRNPNNFPDYSYSELVLKENEIEPWPHADASARTAAMLDSEVLSRELGDDWLTNPVALASSRSGRRSADPRTVLQVPSAVVPQEWNYLVAPSTDNLANRWSQPKPFHIDQRLIDPSLR